MWAGIAAGARSVVPLPVWRGAVVGGILDQRQDVGFQLDLVFLQRKPHADRVEELPPQAQIFQAEALVLLGLASA